MHECWRKAIEIKLLALEENHSWDVVMCPSMKPIVSECFLLRFFYGSIDRYKAQLMDINIKSMA
jgi:hypothetical protein